MEENKELRNEEQLAKAVSEEVIKEIKKEMPKMTVGRTYSVIKDIITGVLICLLVLWVSNFYSDWKQNTSSVAPVDNHDLTVENNGLLGFTAADFEKVILGAAERKALLIVDEQELSVPSVITKAGLFNWGIFSKNQSVTYYGMAQYTVDLSVISSKDIIVDENRHSVTVMVPHPELHEVFFDTSKTVFGDTEKGWLAFGDITMTAEQNQMIEEEAVSRLEERALEKDCLAKADSFAKYVLRDFLETFTDEISNSYKVKIEFLDRVETPETVQQN